MRRLALTLLCVLAWAGPAWAQVSITQTGAWNTGAYDGSNQKTYTGLSAVSVGEVVICGVTNLGNRTFSSVTMGGQTATAATVLNAAFEDQGIYFRVWTGAESGQDVVVTISGSDSSTPNPMNCLVASGLASDQSSLDGVSESSGSATSHDAGPVTPDTAHNLVVGFSGLRANRAWANDAGWTDVGATSNTYAFVYDIQTAADARTWVFSEASAGAASLSIAAFNGTSTSSCTGGLALLGAGKC